MLNDDAWLQPCYAHLSACTSMMSFMFSFFRYRTPPFFLAPIPVHGSRCFFGFETSCAIVLCASRFCGIRYCSSRDRLSVLCLLLRCLFCPASCRLVLCLEKKRHNSPNRIRTHMSARGGTCTEYAQPAATPRPRALRITARSPKAPWRRQGSRRFSAFELQKMPYWLALVTAAILVPAADTFSIAAPSPAVNADNSISWLSRTSPAPSHTSASTGGERPVLRMTAASNADIVGISDDLRGKVAVVTGSSRGIGKGIAVTLGERGCTVYVTGRSAEGACTDQARALLR